jgi:hypothetical protein
VNKRIFYSLLILSLIIIGTYLFIRIGLSSGKKEEQEKGSSGKELPSVSAESDLDLRPLLVAKLQELIKMGSNGLYSFTLDSLVIDVTQSRVTLFNAALNYDSKALRLLETMGEAPPDVFRIKLNNLHIEGINVDEVLNQKRVDLQLVRINNPYIQLFHKQPTRNPKHKRTLYQQLMKDKNHISVKRILVKGGTLMSYDLSKKNAVTKLNEVHLSLSNILIDSSTQYKKKRFLFSEKAELITKNFVQETKDKLYFFKIGTVSVTTPNNILTATNVSLDPKYDKKTFQNRIPSMKEHYQLKIARLRGKGIEWGNLLNQQKLMGENIVLEDGQLDVYLDRSLPPPSSKLGSFPHQLMMKIPIPVYFPDMTVKNLSLSYEEMNPKSGKSGKVMMDKINMTVSNITNLPDRIKTNPYTEVKASGLFMQQVPLNTVFRFDLSRYKEGSFSSEVKIDTVEGSRLNSMAEPLGLFKIDKGKINGLKATVAGDEQKARGDVQLLYDGLNISLLKKNENKSGALKEKEILGFVANRLMIKNENPDKGKSTRTAEAFFERDPKAGFFNLIWKTILVGMLKTIGAPSKIAKKK